MTSSTDIAIVGGGLIGLTSAWYLLDAGYRVTVIEAGRIGQEASWAGGGILFPIYPWKYPPAVQRLAQRGRAIYAHFTAAVDSVSGIDSENRQTGLVVLDTEEQAEGEAWARAHDEPVSRLDATTLRRRFGNTEHAQGLFFAEAAQVRNPRLCQSLRLALACRGATLIEHTPVTGVQAVRGRFAGFETTDGGIRAEYGVVAAGAWSSDLLGAGAAMPIFPVGGQMLLLRGEPGQLASVLLAQGRYAIPRRDGRILVGSTLEAPSFDKRTDDTTAAALRSSAAMLSQALAPLPVERHWAGLRPATADELPLIGAAPGLSGLYFNTGQYRNGVLCAPSSAELLCDAIVNDREAPEPAFSPNRASVQKQGATSTPG
jgi:glycine oxidase